MTEQRFWYLTEDLDLTWETPYTLDEINRIGENDDPDWGFIFDLLIKELVSNQNEDSRRAHWARMLIA